jgi:hypothetical protein
MSPSPLEVIAEPALILDNSVSAARIARSVARSRHSGSGLRFRANQSLPNYGQTGRNPQARLADDAGVMAACWQVCQDEINCGSPLQRISFNVKLTSRVSLPR